MYLEARHFSKSRDGVSAVEFALIAPVLIYILSAIFGYGLLFMTTISVRQLGADTARATIGGLTLTEKEQLAETHLANAASDYLLLEPEQVKFKLEQGRDPSTTILVVTYVPKAHPIRMFRGILPLTDQEFRAEQSIREHR